MIHVIFPGTWLLHNCQGLSVATRIHWNPSLSSQYESITSKAGLQAQHLLSVSDSLTGPDLICPEISAIRRRRAFWMLITRYHVHSEAQLREKNKLKTFFVKKEKASMPIFNGIVQLKWKILSSFTQPHPKPVWLFSSVEQRGWYACLFIVFFFSFFFFLLFVHSMKSLGSNVVLDNFNKMDITSININWSLQNLKSVDMKLLPRRAILPDLTHKNWAAAIYTVKIPYFISDSCYLH